MSIKVQDDVQKPKSFSSLSQRRKATRIRVLTFLYDTNLITTPLIPKSNKNSSKNSNPIIVHMKFPEM